MNNMRRLIDILLSTLALVLLSPLLLAVAITVAIDSRGNPFYPSWRCGLAGKQFRMWKFRSMIPNADRIGPAITARQDPRITKLGRLLRVTKIDELPQFINVLTGDMTLVGPRPEAPGIVALYTPAQRRVLDVKPGLTGRNQLAGEESETIPLHAEPEHYYVTQLMHKKLHSDLQYLEARTPWSDTRVVFDTVSFIFRAWVRK